MPDSLAWSEEACTEAASLGLLQVLDELEALKPIRCWSKEVWRQAAAAGQLEVLHWAVHQEFAGCIQPQTCFEVAAQHGHGSICRWIFKRYPDMFEDYRRFHSAAEQGNWAVIDELIAINTCGLPLSSTDQSCVNGLEWKTNAMHGSLEFTEWIKSHGLSRPVTHKEIRSFARCGNFHILQGLLACKIQLESIGVTIYTMALVYGSMSTLRHEMSGHLHHNGHMGTPQGASWDHILWTPPQQTHPSSS
ncbi:hypothetical protein WJX74_003781 [Apatococcus lobatus]|uniref:Ankyrin repeat-containing domain n=1 Tax=Apatococcus lobatus TaxID=904363 RepID=A0AAW1R253_9CHLO